MFGSPSIKSPGVTITQAHWATVGGVPLNADGTPNNAAVTTLIQVDGWFEDPADLSGGGSIWRSTRGSVGVNSQDGVARDGVTRNPTS